MSTSRDASDAIDGRAATTSRVLAATPDEVYAAFSDAGVLARWWGPAGFTNLFHTFEFMEGGAWHFTMHGPDGGAYENACTFARLEPGRSLVIHHESAPVFDLFVTLDEHAEGTELRWRQVFETAELCARLAHIVVPSNEQNLDRLEAVLAGG